MPIGINVNTGNKVNIPIKVKPANTSIYRPLGGSRKKRHISLKNKKSKTKKRH